MASHFPLQIACILLGALLPVRRCKTTLRDSRVNGRPVWQNEPRNIKDFNGGLFGRQRLIKRGHRWRTAERQNGPNEPKPKNLIISIQAFRAASSGKNGRSS